MSTDAAPTDAELSQQAVDALTDLALRTRVRGAGTEHEVRERVDMGEHLAHVLAAVAANVGDVETLLEGRPGSWEAQGIRELVGATTGGDLRRWRTRPVPLEVGSYATDYLDDAWVRIQDLLDPNVGRVPDGDQFPAGGIDLFSDHPACAAYERVKDRGEELVGELVARWRENLQASAETYLAETGAPGLRVELVDHYLGGTEFAAMDSYGLFELRFEVRCPLAGALVGYDGSHDYGPDVVHSLFDRLSAVLDEDQRSAGTLGPDAASPQDLALLVRVCTDTVWDQRPADPVHVLDAIAPAYRSYSDGTPVEPDRR